jgi:hypothetical protein
MPVDRAAFEDTWRVRCPEGHVRVNPMEGAETAYCESCERSYAFEKLVDGEVEA